MLKPVDFNHSRIQLQIYNSPKFKSSKKIYNFQDANLI